MLLVWRVSSKVKSWSCSVTRLLMRLATDPVTVPGVLLWGCEFRTKFLVEKCQHGYIPSQSPNCCLLTILMINNPAAWIYYVAWILIWHSMLGIHLFCLLLHVCKYHPLFTCTPALFLCFSCHFFLSTLFLHILPKFITVDLTWAILACISGNEYFSYTVQVWCIYFVATYRTDVWFF